MNKVIGYTNLKLDGLEYFLIRHIDGKNEVIDTIEVVL